MNNKEDILERVMELKISIAKQQRKYQKELTKIAKLVKEI